MKIIVCIKQVPDTNEVRLNPETGTLIRDGVPSIINPDDKSGLEAALAMKDLHGAHVTVLTMGPPKLYFLQTEPSPERIHGLHHLRLQRQLKKWTMTL